MRVGQPCRARWGAFFFAGGEGFFFFFGWFFFLFFFLWGGGVFFFFFWGVFFCAHLWFFLFRPEAGRVLRAPSLKTCLDLGDVPLFFFLSFDLLLFMRKAMQEMEDIWGGSPFFFSPYVGDREGTR